MSYVTTAKSSLGKPRHRNARRNSMRSQSTWCHASMYRHPRREGELAIGFFSLRDSTNGMLE
ncbi:hypothetical protein ACKWRH_05915 [Bradyrhizobium sp. Pa8]|uniref:hypothetical protein n=1 Tax=Bradyrhizobium sp. Pa8 TaxID=3386552 RepID=UPI00403F22DA